jgi:hypothetical protein
MSRSGTWGSRARFATQLGVVGVCLAWAFSACATGASSDDSDVTDNSTTTTTGGGMGGMGGGTTVTTGGMGGMGGTPIPCDDDPCKLTLPQCGCTADQKCDYNSNAGTRSCVADGTIPAQGECAGDNCAAGALCLNLYSLSTCHAYCDSDMDCQGGGGKCLMTINGDMGNQMFCSDNCDPVSSVGCNVPGSKCIGSLTTMNVGFSVCVGSGSGTQGQPCSLPNNCAAGFQCVNDGMTDLCARYCNMASPQCMGIEQCIGFNTPLLIGSIEYGVCF